MKIYHYGLIDPNDQDGNDDGILSRMDMTEAEAFKRNNILREEKDDRRWVKLSKEPINKP